MYLIKPKFWERKNSILSLILVPISMLLICFVYFRKKFTKIVNYEIPIICVGNLYLGGTGKTPLSILIGEELTKKGINPTIIDARFVKPLDENLFWQLATTHEAFITIEEGSIGGFGSHVSQFLNEKNLLDSNLKFRSMILPDKFIDHDKPEKMYKLAGLDSVSIENKVLEVLNSKVVIKKTN